jgi:hypothetical protein
MALRRNGSQGNNQRRRRLHQRRVVALASSPSLLSQSASSLMPLPPLLLLLLQYTASAIAPPGGRQRIDRCSWLLPSYVLTSCKLCTSQTTHARVQERAAADARAPVAGRSKHRQIKVVVCGMQQWPRGVRASPMMLHQAVRRLLQLHREALFRDSGRCGRRRRRARGRRDVDPTSEPKIGRELPCAKRSCKLVQIANRPAIISIAVRSVPTTDALLRRPPPRRIR